MFIQWEKIDGATRSYLEVQDSCILYSNMNESMKGCKLEFEDLENEADFSWTLFLVNIVNT